MYNKYIVPICNIAKSDVYILKISAPSIAECEDKLMNKFSEYSNANSYSKFVRDLDKKDILIGEIQDIEEL